jgi:TatD DNase family protein
MYLFDAHCHLQDERFKSGLDAVMTRAGDNGVVGLMCCGSSQADWDDTIAVAAGYPQVLVALGLHPWYVSEKGSGWLETLETLIQNSTFGIGEIGLDHAIDNRNDEDQRSVFVRQVRLAKKYHRPVSIHCRQAWAALLTVVKEERGFPDGAVIHSYSGAPELIPELAERGCYFSFSGSLTYKGNKHGPAALRAVPVDRLLLETDSPAIKPAGVDGTCNEPANLPVVARKVAELLGSSFEETAKLTYNNSRRLFNGGKS